MCVRALAGDNKDQKAESVDFAGAKVPPEWAEKVGKVLFTAEQIQTRVRELAATICKKYEGKSILAVGLLNGAFVFVSDLLRHFTVPYAVDFMVVSSYGHGTTSSGSIKLKKDLSIDPRGKHVLIIEDLIDTGNTLAWIRNHLKTKECASVELVCLLDKTTRRTTKVDVEYVGFTCPDEFVVGASRGRQNFGSIARLRVQATAWMLLTPSDAFRLLAF